jgi:hypothetical protein
MMAASATTILNDIDLSTRLRADAPDWRRP